MAKKNAANVVGVKTKTTWKQAFKRDWQLYLLLLSIPGIADGLYGL